MTSAEAQSKSIDGRARIVCEMLDKAKYAIDFYQRENAMSRFYSTLGPRVLPVRGASA